jgi:predicted metal-binding protein
VRLGLTQIAWKGKAGVQHITICESCRAGEAAPRGRALADQLRGLVAGLAEVRTVDCMIVCGDPVTVSFRAPGKAAYLFAGVDPDAQADELAAFARLYDAAPDGVIDDARPCGALRFCLVGRIPA